MIQGSLEEFRTRGVQAQAAVDAILEPHAKSTTLDLESRFWAFHEANPKVLAELKRLALRAIGRGHKRIGIGALWEVMRWNLTIETNDPDFKLNNNYRSRYARLIMGAVPELEGAFELRELKTGSGFKK